VQVKYPLFLREKSVPNADFIFANTWDTAIPISRYSAQKGIKYYFVQNHDLWSASKEVINQTFKLNFKVIVIANWLKEIVEGSGGEVRAVIPNGIDLDIFKVKDPIAERKPLIGMLYHKFDWKGSADGLEALRLVKEKYPKIEAALFGVYPRPEGLPEWIKYYQNPKQADLVNLYNSFSIFISPSWFEGWPLPPAEAMACGAALVSTDIAGVSDYAINNKTALLSPIKAPEKLAENIIKLLNDDALRVQLAESGNSRIKDFSWDKAVERFIQALD
jgi:glycosyltransferase involved in cell wall biosynthesis